MGAPAAAGDDRGRSVLEALIAADRDAGRLAIVDRLLAEFGTAANAILGSRARRRRAGANAQVAATLDAVRLAIQHVLRAPLLERPVLADWRALLNYLRADMAFAHVERIRVLHLDTRNGLIRDDIVGEGTIDHVWAHPREIIARALELGSAALILVHNHPSGDTTPSRSDIDLTRSVVDAGRVFGITVHDHLIIGSRGHISLRSKGLM